MESSILTLNEILQKEKRFVIPNYQRGYIWGKKHGYSSKNSVEYILDCIKNSDKNKRELFLQGITVTEDDEFITLIDGQQRMTFFYLLLTYLKSKADFPVDCSMRIDYSIRKESQDFLESINKNYEIDGEIEAVCSSIEEKKGQLANLII